MSGYNLSGAEVSELWSPCFAVINEGDMNSSLDKVTQVCMLYYGIKPMFAYSDNIFVVRNLLTYFGEKDLFRSPLYEIDSLVNEYEYNDGVKPIAFDSIVTVKDATPMRPEGLGVANNYVTILSLISSDRTRDRDVFLTIGGCIYTILGDIGYRLWKDFVIDFRKKECFNSWPQLTKVRSSLKTLIEYAKADDPIGFKKIERSIFIRASEAFDLLSTDIDLAKIIHDCYSDRFLTANEDPTSKAWYEFNGNCFNKLDGDFKVRNFLERDIMPVYRHIYHSLDDANERIACHKIITMFGSEDGKNRIMRSLYRLYSVDINELNKRILPVFAFNDCVFDLNTLSFRKGNADEKILMSTRYNFIDVLSEMEAWGEDNWKNHPKIKLIDEYIINRIVTDEQKREFLIRQFAAALNPRNNKRAIILYGPSNNGKTYLMNLIRKAFGSEYAPPSSNILFSAGPKTGTPSPEYAMLKGKIFIQPEVDDTMKLNESLFKTVTGGAEEITYRKLYSNDYETFTPCCLVVIVCNTYPKFNGSASAIANRLLSVSLDSTFITGLSKEMDELNLCETEEAKEELMKRNKWFHADTDLESKINDVCMYMMYYLIQTYKTYKMSEGTVEMKTPPESISKTTIDMMKSRNIYYQYISHCVRYDSKRSVAILALYDHFKLWFNAEVNSRESPPSLHSFEEGISLLNIKPGKTENGTRYYDGIYTIDRSVS